MAETTDAVQAASAAVAAGVAGASQEALSRIEELLKLQTEQTKKLLRSSRWRTVFLCALVVTFVVAGFAFYNLAQDATARIPAVMDQADELIVSARAAIQTIVTKFNSLNIDALNESIEGIASINYRGLNTSIEGLASAVESFQSFVDALSHPAQTIGGLFGG